MNKLVEQWRELSRRDDLFTYHMVPSDVRVLLMEIERLDGDNNRLREVVLWAKTAVGSHDPDDLATLQEVLEALEEDTSVSATPSKQEN